MCRGTFHTRARRALRADSRRRALDIRATRTRARRALTALSFAGTAVNDDRLRFGYTALEYILAQVRNRRAFSLQHILAHIRSSGARRNAALEHILAHIRIIRALRALTVFTGVVSARNSFTTSAHRVGSLESLRLCR